MGRPSPRFSPCIRCPRCLRRSVVLAAGAGESSSRPARLQPTQRPTPRPGIEQGACAGDGLCVQYAPEVFEFDIDGLAYVKDADGDLKQPAGARVAVPD